MKIKQASTFQLAGLLIPIISLFWALQGFALTVNEVTKDLTCTCDCNLVVSACAGTMECGTARQIADEVAGLIGQGKSKDEIIGLLVQTRGERILAAPTKKGFNLTAWTLPFLAIVLGALGLAAFLNRCIASRQAAAAEAEAGKDNQAVDEKYRDQFEKELNAFE